MDRTEVVEKEVFGVVRSMSGDTLIIDMGTEGLCKLQVKDKEERWKIYCRNVKISIDSCTEDDVLASGQF